MSDVAASHSDHPTPRRHGGLRMTPASVIVIVLAVIAVAVIGSHFSVMNREWYEALNKPSFQPPNWVFGAVWTTLFILAAISAMLIWNTRPQTATTYWVMALFAANGLLNVAWSALFFGNKLIYPAIWDSGLLCLSSIAIIALAWPISRAGAILFIPYAAWTAFATFLTWTILRLN